MKKIITLKKGQTQKGITIIALVITIILLLILTGIAIVSLTGENGILSKANTAKEKSNKNTATQIVNLKITEAQIQSYADIKKMPTLQYLADRFCEDEEIQYVELNSKKTAKLNKIEIGEAQAIYTKLKDYPYEFEINKQLKLASINGVQIADNTNSKEVEELKETVENLQNIITNLQNKIEEIGNEQRKTMDYSASVNQEKLIGKWYDGSDMYELTVPIKLPSATTNGTTVWNKIDLQAYNIKDCKIMNGYFKDTKSGTDCPIPIWIAAGTDRFARVLYFNQEKKLGISNSYISYNGSEGYVTIHYNKI